MYERFHDCLDSFSSVKFCELWYVVYFLLFFFLSPFNIFCVVFAQLANYVGGEYCPGFTDMTNRSYQ